MHACSIIFEQQMILLDRSQSSECVPTGKWQTNKNERNLLFPSLESHLVLCTDFAIRVARFLSVQNTKTGKIYQMTLKYTKWPQKMPNGHKIDQTAIKCTNFFHCKTLQNWDFWF
jgi:hypothetical protein